MTAVALPEPAFHLKWDMRSRGYYLCAAKDGEIPLHTADQMREYGEACAKEARQIALEEAAKACEGEHITFLAARAVRALMKEQG